MTTTQPSTPGTPGLEYTSHDNDRLLDHVDAMQLTGVNVMIGIYSNGTAELALHEETACTPHSARWAFIDDSLPIHVLDPDTQSKLIELSDTHDA